MANDHVRSQGKRALQASLVGVPVLLSAFVSPALAHHPMGGATPATWMQGLLSGIGHPVIGIDHLAFIMVATVLAAAVTGRARFAVPLAFVCATIAGTMFHLSAGDLPLSETLVALSLVIGGVFAVAWRNPRALLVSVILAVGGVLHGYAYGEAVIGAETTPLVAYLVGLVAVQYAIMVVGLWGLSKAAAYSGGLRSAITRVSGVVATVVGSLFLVLSVA
jgi:urease accessory protein